MNTYEPFRVLFYLTLIYSKYWHSSVEMGPLRYTKNHSQISNNMQMQLLYNQ